MNTVTAYARRAKAARNAARAIVANGLPLTRKDAERAAHLADYANRCADLACEAEGGRDTAAARDALSYACETSAAWGDLRTLRLFASNVRRACRANDRVALAGELGWLVGSPLVAERTTTLATRSLKRLATLPAGRPAVDALSWDMARALDLSADMVETIRKAA